MLWFKVCLSYINAPLNSERKNEKKRAVVKSKSVVSLLWVLMRRKRQIRSLLNVSLNSLRVSAIRIVFNFLIFIYLYNLIGLFS